MNMKRINILLPIALIFTFFFNSCKEKGIKLSTSPEVLLEKMINNPAFEKNPNGESFCWQANVGASQYVNNYEVTGDAKWLDAGVKYFDFPCS